MEASIKIRETERNRLQLFCASVCCYLEFDLNGSVMND